jgi:hypothetical protein
LKDYEAKSYIFFRQCTLPSESILHLINDGAHKIGLHLENSRSFDTFLAEKERLENHIKMPVLTFSKHGSGHSKYGFHHYAPYEPDKYLEWGYRCGMKIFFGNLEDPSIVPSLDHNNLSYFPAAFWLEPSWRNTKIFTIEWLIEQSKQRDIVLLLHPENVLGDISLLKEFERLLSSLKTRILE